MKNSSCHQVGNGDCFVARTPETLEQVFRLRYACYRRKGSIDSREDGQFRDTFDQLPNSFSFLARSASQEALATVRITVVQPEFGWTDSPVAHVYGDHPAFHDIAAESFVEASRLCFGRQARRDEFVRLLSNMAAIADLYDVRWLVACPRVEHVHVYQRMFGFRPLAAPRKYFGVNFETQLLGIERAAIHDYVRQDPRMTDACSQALARLMDERHAMRATAA